MTTTVLLGARASKDAGVPTTTEIAKRMLAVVAEDHYSAYHGTSAALNFVVGPIIAHDSAAGAMPSVDTIDVERVFSAVDLLATARRT